MSAVGEDSQWPDCPDCETEVYVHATQHNHQGVYICEFCGTRWEGDV
jgi:predicted RNA-binding Zn-ribbon protein involved in translation (DUF1610 family)